MTEDKYTVEDAAKDLTAIITKARQQAFTEAAEMVRAKAEELAGAVKRANGDMDQWADGMIDAVNELSTLANAIQKKAGE